MLISSRNSFESVLFINLSNKSDKLKHEMVVWRVFSKWRSFLTFVIWYGLLWLWGICNLWKTWEQSKTNYFLYFYLNRNFIKGMPWLWFLFRFPKNSDRGYKQSARRCAKKHIQGRTHETHLDLMLRLPLVTYQIRACL